MDELKRTLLNLESERELIDKEIEDVKQKMAKLSMERDGIGIGSKVIRSGNVYIVTGCRFENVIKGYRLIAARIKKDGIPFQTAFPLYGDIEIVKE